MWFSGKAFYVDTLLRFGMVPEQILAGKSLYTLFTSMFLHADWFHIGFNMLYLFVFGDNVEGAFGHKRFIVFYFLCGLVADVFHIVSLLLWNSAELSIVTIGASGAISGVLGAYVVMYPKAKVLTLILLRPVIVPLPAIFFLGIWFLYQLLASFLDISGGVAYWAHIGGFVAGIVLASILRQRKREE
jgi:membrane associated rhomboid family serine protease